MNERSLVKNAASEKQVRRAVDKEKFREEQEMNDLRFVMNNRAGRRFMYRYICKCGVFKLSAQGGSVQDQSTFLNEGRRDIGLSLLGDIQDAAPEAYSLMMSEANQEKENNK